MRLWILSCVLVISACMQSQLPDTAGLRKHVAHLTGWGRVELVAGSAIPGSSGLWFTVLNASLGCPW